LIKTHSLTIWAFNLPPETVKKAKNKFLGYGPILRGFLKISLTNCSMEPIYPKLFKAIIRGSEGKFFFFLNYTAPNFGMRLVWFFLTVKMKFEAGIPAPKNLKINSVTEIPIKSNRILLHIPLPCSENLYILVSCSKIREIRSSSLHKSRRGFFWRAIS